MAISYHQSRAARALLNWSQEVLANNAGVSRATVADFENKTRVPIRNNLRAIEYCMYAAGVEFLPDSDDMGKGVRFRTQRLESRNTIWFVGENAKMKMSFRDQPFDCIVSKEAVEDFLETNFNSGQEFSDAVDKIQATIFAVAEKHAPFSIQNGKMVITSSMLA